MNTTRLIAALLGAALSTGVSATTIMIDGQYQGPFTAYQNPDGALQSSELHVIGIYEAGNDASCSGASCPHVRYDATVAISGGNVPLTLVLSSYEPVRWIFNVSPGTNLKSVILNGGYAQEFSGVDAALIHNASGFANWMGTYAVDWPNDSGGGGNTQLFVSNIENFTNLELTSFIGTYRANSFSIVAGVAPAQIPVPAPIYLIGMGLFGLCLMGRKRSARQRQ